MSFINELKELQNKYPIHFAGIGGSAMAGLAMLMNSRGYRIVGTDPNLDATTQARLESAEISVSNIQDGTQIPDDCQLVVTTAALSNEHQELEAARARNIPIIKYAKMLGLLMNSQQGVAVAGTHGKTTTTALCVSSFRGADTDPGFVIGGYVPQFKTSAYNGYDNIFLAEACEYDRSFLNLQPNIAIITNIEEDHLDIYANLDEIIECFQEFADNIQPKGTLIYCHDDRNSARVAAHCTRETRSYGFADTATYQARHIAYLRDGIRFEIWHNEQCLGTVQLQLHGRHNVLNALAAFAAGHTLGLETSGLLSGLRDFNGVSRRFEFVGKKSGVSVYDDYAHHPTEIRALLSGLKHQQKDRRLIVVFQPHQISRTAFLFDDFSTAFSDADAVFLPPIYAARDANAPSDVTSERLATAIQSNGTDTTYCLNFEDAAQKVAIIAQEGDLVLTVGAGDIHLLGKQILKRIL